MRTIPLWHFRVQRQAPLFPAYSVTESLAKVNTALQLRFNYQTVRYLNYEWLFSMKEEQELEKILHQKWIADSLYLHRYVQRQYRVGESLKKYVRKISRATLSAAQLKTELHRYIQKMLEFYTYWWMAVPAGRFLEKEVKEILLKHGFKDDFGELVRSSKKLELSKDQVELLRLARQIKGKRFSELTTAQKNRLKRHAEHFGWLSTTYHLGKPQSIEELYEKAQKSDPEKELKVIEGREDKYHQIMFSLQKKISKKELRTIQSMQEVIFSRNYQKETVNECQHRSEPFLQRIAEKIGVSWDDFLCLTPDEAEQALAKKILPQKNILEARKKGYAVIIERRKVFATTDVDKYLIKAEERDDFQPPAEMIKGQPGCRGKVIGVVRVIMEKRELNTFKEGEILVTSMTSIDFVPVMKKAAAIITNEGGITCHAAIVSRELNVPCVIGTNVATKILHTGDEVEVDATKGVVRIVKKR